MSSIYHSLTVNPLASSLGPPDPGSTIWQSLFCTLDAALTSPPHPHPWPFPHAWPSSVRRYKIDRHADPDPRGCCLFTSCPLAPLLAGGHYFTSEALLHTGIGKGAVKGNGLQEPNPGLLPPSEMFKSALSSASSEHRRLSHQGSTQTSHGHIQPLPLVLIGPMPLFLVQASAINLLTTDTATFRFIPRHRPFSVAARLNESHRSPFFPY